MTRDVVIRQYQSLVRNTASLTLRDGIVPPEGWLATMRRALGMSAAQLARRVGFTRARVSKAEAVERAGGITLNSLQAMAAAMDCRLVYAIVPVNGDVADIVMAQARRKAAALIRKAGTHMALEQQQLTDAANAAEIERVAAQLLARMPADFWNDA